MPNGHHNLATVDQMIATMQVLRDDIVGDNKPEKQPPSRVISRSARNVQLGMWAEFPERGWVQVHGWSMEPDRVLLSDGGQAFWSVKPRQRIRTRLHNG